MDFIEAFYKCLNKLYSQNREQIPQCLIQCKQKIEIKELSVALVAGFYCPIHNPHRVDLITDFITVNCDQCKM